MNFQVFFALVIFVFLFAATGLAGQRRDHYRVMLGDNSGFNYNKQLEKGHVDSIRDLIRKLSAQRAAVKRGGKVTQPFFSVRGQILKINGEEIQVFEYKSAKNAASEAKKVSSDGSPIGTSMVNWIASPHFFKSGRLIVLYVGSEPGVIKLLENALDHQFAGK